MKRRLTIASMVLAALAALVLTPVAAANFIGDPSGGCTQHVHAGFTFDGQYYEIVHWHC